MGHESTGGNYERLERIARKLYTIGVEVSDIIGAVTTETLARELQKRGAYVIMPEHKGKTSAHGEA